jgi:uncharacterized repeat protein (TIGR03803 family)
VRGEYHRKKHWVNRVISSLSGTARESRRGRVSEASLIRDKSGHLYGTTAGGGSSSGCTSPGGCGTVFELTPPKMGKSRWTHKVLHSFCAQGGSLCTDGADPAEAGVIMDASGNLYGTTANGGAYGGGTAFELKP